MAARGFAAGPEAYERGRPTYPPDAVAALCRGAGIETGADVVELGPGTGKLTGLLVQAGARVVAVEPVPEMRERLSEAVPGVAVVDATAEASTLPAGSADAVVAAQAFHWFRGEEALAEAHRLLRPGGGLGLIWALRDERAHWVRALSRLIEPYEGDVPRYRWGGWRPPFERTTLFTPLEESHFGYDQEMDTDSLVMRVASISFIATLPEPERDQVLARTRDLVKGLGDRFVLPHVVDVYWCRRR